MEIEEIKENINSNSSESNIPEIESILDLDDSLLVSINYIIIYMIMKHSIEKI